MKRLHYIGNKLHNSKSNTTSIDILGSLFEIEGYTVSYASSMNNTTARMLDMIWSVFKHRKHIDFILIDTYSTLNFYYAVIISQIARLMKLQYIPILRGGDLSRRLKSNKKACELLFKNSYVNVVPSLFLKESFENFGYKRLLYIPNTIELKNYPFTLNHDLTTLKILWVRSFSKIYNPSMAVKLLKNLKDMGYDATLCMVGPDTDDGSFEETKNLADTLNLKVNFTGKLSKPDWIKLSQDYNIFINTTNIDNTPVSVIEAMALGLPIVSTNVGGMPYLITHKTNGLLVEKDNVNAMTVAIVTIIENESEREQMILNARALSETFDWQRVKMQWNDILQK